MFDALRGADQRQIGCGVLLVAAFRDDLLAFLDQSHHALAGLGARRRTQHPETFVETLDLTFGLRQMLFEKFAQLVEACRLHHLGERLGKLLLCMKDVAQFIDQEISEAGFDVPVRIEK